MGRRAPHCHQLQWPDCHWHSPPFLLTHRPLCSASESNGKQNNACRCLAFSNVNGKSILYSHSFIALLSTFVYYISLSLTTRESEKMNQTIKRELRVSRQRNVSERIPPTLRKLKTRLKPSLSYPFHHLRFCWISTFRNIDSNKKAVHRASAAISAGFSLRRIIIG